MAKVKVIYSDTYLMVLDKDPGLVVDKSDTQTEGTLEDILKLDFQIKLERGGIVHRLDKDTSGVILVAKTQQTLENLQKQFQERKVKKEYLALVHGSIDEPLTVEGSIGRNPVNREKFTVTEEGKEAMTKYEPVQLLVMSSESIEKVFEGFNKIQLRKLRTMNYELFTLLSCKPITGRTHQIRVHLKYINHPVVSDEKYAGRKISRLDKRWCPRIFLHAARIGFRHPVSNSWMVHESPLPQDLKGALSLLELSYG